MEKNNNMPPVISYTLLVHAGSYKTLLKKLKDDFPELEILYTKKKAVHYYIICIRETGRQNYYKKDIYKLPLLAMREEFSNYIFFKSIKTYNNVLRIMYDGKNNKKAPYILFQDMLTPLEKYFYAQISNDTKKISYEETSKDNNIVITSIYDKEIFSKDTADKIFNLEQFKVNDILCDFVDKIKTQKLRIGII